MYVPAIISLKKQKNGKFADLNGNKMCIKFIKIKVNGYVVV